VTGPQLAPDVTNNAADPTFLASNQTFQHYLEALRQEVNGPRMALQQVIKSLQSYSDTVSGLGPDLQRQLAAVDAWQGQAKDAFFKSISDQVDATQPMPPALGNTIQALNDLAGTIASTYEAAVRLEPPQPPTSSGGEYPTLIPGTGPDAVNKLVDLINSMVPHYQDAVTALGALATMQWPGPRAASGQAVSPDAAAAPKGGAGGAPGGGAGGAAKPNAGGAGAGGAGAGGAAAGAGGASDPSAASGSDPSAAGDPSASDPGSTSDPNALPNDPNVNSPSLPNDPSVNTPSLPNDPTVNVPNVPNTNVPQLAGNPSTIQLPPNSSTTPPSKIPDLNLPTGSSSAGGGAINLPSVLPPGTTPNQPGTGGPSSPSPGTATAGGTAPKPGGLAGEPAAAAGAKTSGMPYLPPPMGGMGGGGRQGGGVKPGTAEQAGGPELGGLGGPAGKPIEEIGVPARLRGRGAAARSARPVRPARPRRASSAGRGSTKGAAQSSGPTVDDSGEVLDEQLWRVDPPAMSDE